MPGVDAYTDRTPQRGAGPGAGRTSGETGSGGGRAPDPIRLAVQEPPTLSRWLLFVKWLFAIPAIIVNVLYGVLVVLTTFLAFWAILFTGRYPPGLFGVARGYWRLHAQTIAYFPLLLTDAYPLGDALDSDVNYDADEPAELSRGLLLLKAVTYVTIQVPLLLASLALALGILAAIPAWFAILITGRYPAGLRTFVAGTTAYYLRASAWQYLMTDDWEMFTPAVAAEMGRRRERAGTEH